MIVWPKVLSKQESSIEMNCFWYHLINKEFIDAWLFDSRTFGLCLLSNFEKTLAI